MKMAAVCWMKSVFTPVMESFGLEQEPDIDEESLMSMDNVDAVLSNLVRIPSTT